VTWSAGDASGVVVVPRADLDTVLALARAVEQREAVWRQAIADGVSVAEATGAEIIIDQRRGTTTAPLP
jgi:regulator of RNase E activity RraA